MNTITWNIERYAAGVYYLSTGSPDGKMLKIIKQ
jgi:hypothetical protein